MKKINIFLLGVLVAMAGFFSSCTKEEDPSGPQISFSNDQTETTLGTAVTSFEINATITSIVGLDQVKVFKVANNGDENQLTSITSFSDKTNFHLTYSVTGITEETTIKVSATDKNDVTNSKTFLIKVPAASISTYTGTLLYVPDANKSNKVYFASSTGETFSYNGIGTNSSKVDFGYYYGTSAGHSFYALTDNPITSYDLSNWTKNATILKKLSSVNFDALTSSSDIATACGTIGTVKIVNSLAVNDVVGFKTAAGKYGVIKITAKSADSNAETTNITFSVKVQK